MCLDAINMLLYTSAELINTKFNICKNKSLVSFIDMKDLILKGKFHTNYKKYRNFLSTLIKKSKQAYYDKYFETNWNDVNNTWKGIKSLVSLKTVAPSV